VVEVLALQQDGRPGAGGWGGVLGEAPDLGERAGAARVVGQQRGQLLLELGVDDGAGERLLELLQGGVQRLRDELAPELLEVAGGVRQRRPAGLAGGVGG
jgi:hypothetical protein